MGENRAAGESERGGAAALLCEERTRIASRSPSGSGGSPPEAPSSSLRLGLGMFIMFSRCAPSFGLVRTARGLTVNSCFTRSPSCCPTFLNWRPIFLNCHATSSAPSWRGGAGAREVLEAACADSSFPGETCSLSRQTPSGRSSGL